MDTLTRMRAFIDVVEAEGFSAAARKIGRSKALLSKYVRELEDELGALLLNRTTRQFSLTEAGHTYYKRASEIVREVDSLADAVRESSGDVRGRIKLSAPRTFADAPIGQSLIDFAKEHPDIVLEIASRRPLRRPCRGRLRPRHPHHAAGKLLADRAAAGAVFAAGLRLAGADRQTRQADPPAGPRRMFPASSTPMAAGCPTGRSSATMAELVSVAVSGPIEVNSPLAARAAAVSGPRLRHPAGFHRRAGDREGPARAGADRPHAEGRRHLRRLSASPLSAGQGAGLRRLPGAVVQEIPVSDRAGHDPSAVLAAT